MICSGTEEIPDLHRVRPVHEEFSIDLKRRVFCDSAPNACVWPKPIAAVTPDIITLYDFPEFFGAKLTIGRRDGVLRLTSKIASEIATCIRGPYTPIPVIPMERGRAK